jgi:hypothetical protein
VGCYVWYLPTFQSNLLLPSSRRDADKLLSSYSSDCDPHILLTFEISVSVCKKRNFSCIVIRYPTSSKKFLLMTNLTHFSQCMYFTPLHISSNKCTSSGGSDCVITSSSIIPSSGRLSCVPVGPTSTQDSHPLEFAIPDDVFTQFILLMMSTCCSKHVQGR